MYMPFVLDCWLAHARRLAEATMIARGSCLPKAIVVACCSRLPLAILVHEAAASCSKRLVMVAPRAPHLAAFYSWFVTQGPTAVEEARRDVTERAGQGQGEGLKESPPRRLGRLGRTGRVKGDELIV
jgi:hypothetical protein